MKPTEQNRTEKNRKKHKLNTYYATEACQHSCTIQTDKWKNVNR